MSKDIDCAHCSGRGYWTLRPVDSKDGRWFKYDCPRCSIHKYERDGAPDGYNDAVKWMVLADSPLGPIVVNGERIERSYWLHLRRCIYEDTLNAKTVKQVVAIHKFTIGSIVVPVAEKEGAGEWM